MSNLDFIPVAPVVEVPEEAIFIPLMNIRFDAQIIGLFAEVTCTQLYQNRTQEPISAKYVFPMPTEASVIACQMTIGGTTIHAQVKAVEEAEEDWDKAMDEGGSAVLLKQSAEDNVFTMNVGGIAPGEHAEVKVTYIQRVPWQNNGGRFTIPLVVAPRFVPAEMNPADEGIELPPVSLFQPVPYKATVKIGLHPGFDCSVSHVSHHTSQPATKVAAHSNYDVMADDLQPNSDYVIAYQSTEEMVGVCTHSLVTVGGPHYGMLTILPPGNTVNKPKDIYFCLDVSGSMSGSKIEGLRKIVKKTITQLGLQNIGHRVGLVEFHTSYEDIHPISDITDATLEAVDRLQPKGMTNAGEAIDYCFEQLSGMDSTREKYIILVADGQTSSRWTQITPGVQVLSVGIDTATNTAYLGELAHLTDGGLLNVYPGEDYDAVTSQLIGLVSGPALRDIEIEPISDEAKILGIKTAYQDYPAILFIKSEEEFANGIKVSGMNNQADTIEIVVNLNHAFRSPFVPQLWAREALRTDEFDEEQQIAISTEYGVICRHTAFIGVMHREVPNQTDPVMVEIPVDLPEMWEFGGGVGGGHLGISNNRGAKGAFEMAFSAPGAGTAAESLLTAAEPDPTPPSTGDVTIKMLGQLAEAIQNSTIQLIPAIRQWNSLLEQLESVTASSTEEQAWVYYLLMWVHTSNAKYKLPSDIVQQFHNEPDAGDADAHSWWTKAEELLPKAKLS